MYMLAPLVSVLLVIADEALANIPNQTIGPVSNRLNVEAINKKLEILDLPENVETRRQEKKKTHRSTSSSSGIKKDSAKQSSGVSLDISESPSESKNSKDKKKKKKSKDAPVSTEERKGWRKWHRKCTPCPAEEGLKWKDPRIKWICGAYQRARRSFKSLCMMHLRNCQDGTMFVKIHDHRCANDSGKEERPFGDHFFYDYKVRMSLESAGSVSTDSTSEESSSMSTS